MPLVGSPPKSWLLHLFVLGDFFHVGSADNQVGHLEDAEFCSAVLMTVDGRTISGAPTLIPRIICSSLPSWLE